MSDQDEVNVLHVDVSKPSADPAVEQHRIATISFMNTARALAAHGSDVDPILGGLLAVYLQLAHLNDRHELAFMAFDVAKEVIANPGRHFGAEG